MSSWSRIPLGQIIYFIDNKTTELTQRASNLKEIIRDEDISFDKIFWDFAYENLDGELQNRTEKQILGKRKHLSQG